jgi:hypothetical protein
MPHGKRREGVMDNAVRTVLIGVGATAMLDAWTILRTRVFGVRAPDYGLVGRWLAHMRHGRIRHAAVGSAMRVRGERVIGWAAHYVTGVVFASLLPLLFGPAWLLVPTLAPALAVGVATVAVPFLLMQPAMGLGVAASRTPRPAAARAQSIVTHAVFGAGLWVAARLIAELFPL